MQIRSLREVEPGERIVLRYRLAGSEEGTTPGPRLSDALGTFLGIRSGSAVVETRSGTMDVPLDAITHAKRVPPPPPRRR